MKETIDNIGVWIGSAFFIIFLACGAGASPDLLVFITGIAIGYMILVHNIHKAEKESDAPRVIVQSFFAYALQGVDFDDEDAVLLGKMHKRIENRVTQGSFKIVNRNNWWSKRKLEIAIYKEIIEEIRYNSKELKISSILQQYAEKHLQLLESKKI